MIYREHAYSVVQTARANSWTWTVQLEGNGACTGESHRREAAIGAAFSAIDKAIETASQRHGVSHEVVDGRMIPKRAM